MPAPLASPAPLPTSPWRATPLIRASLALHLLALVTVLWQPALWTWAAGAVFADHLLLTAAGLWPRSTLLGANIRCLPEGAAARGEVAITIDDGPDPAVTPAVLDLLDSYGARATFFCIGRRARAHPELARAIVERGHALENHTEHHRHNFVMLGPRAYTRELQAAQDSLTAIGGQRPQFFRAPAGLRNPFLGPVLARLNLRLTSWTRRGFDTREGVARHVLRRLLCGLRAGDILLLHDGHAARTTEGQPVILAVLPELLSALNRAGLRPVTLREALI
ncbi:MAG: polysaccharide deacetylase family protein [Chromatiales bacterium 21-64-14]|nr:MAG: polysaccharide deacetylase family protein [Chromatiales bacterium 21-64-14]HQU14650.1 polysaccharide deacetylase family protein [Gammaproteobacteria bacterium]